jgi:hypothetical protein
MVFAAWVRCVPEQAGRVGGVDTRTGVVCVWRGGRTRAPRMASVKAWTGARPRSLSLPPTSSFSAVPRPPYPLPLINSMDYLDDEADDAAIEAAAVAAIAASRKRARSAEGSAGGDVKGGGGDAAAGEAAEIQVSVR